MPVTDPIADMLTRIRNANANLSDEVAVPTSRMKVGLAKILREEGFIKHYKVSRVRPKKPAVKKSGMSGVKRDNKSSQDKRSEIRIFLKFGPKQEQVIHGLRRISKPGLRQYVKHYDIPLVQGGLGITILSTSKGLMSGKSCRREKVGGELLCEIW